MANPLSPEVQAFIQSQMNELKSQVDAKDKDLAELRQQLSDMKMKSKSTDSEIPKASSSSKSPRPSTKAPKMTPSKSASRSKPTSAKSKSTPTKKTSKSPKPPTPKRHESQLYDDELPSDIRPVKDAFYLVIRVLWGLLEKGAVPTLPDRKVLKEFYARFNNPEEIQSALDSAGSLALVAQNEIETLKNYKLQHKAGRGTLNLKEIHIMFIHASLAKIGLRRWGPDLTEATDSLLNSACRISAISAFRQVASGGAFDNNNMNATYLNNVPLLIAVYDHYVHFRMAEKFKTEQKQAGKVKADQERKTIQRGRERLRKYRLRFAEQNKYPLRYQKFLQDVASHSDDEKHPKHDFHVIKTLTYRSPNATKFIRRLDQEMALARTVSKTTTLMHSRRLPKVPQPSIFSRPPQGCALDVICPEYFNSLATHQRMTLFNTQKVIFLPDASKSLLPAPHTHSGEKLSNRKFIRKYYPRLSAPYVLESVDSPSESSDEEPTPGPSHGGRGGRTSAANDDHDTDAGSSIDLQASSDGSDGESAYYEEGEFVEEDFNLSSDDSKDDEDFDPKASVSRSGSGKSSSEEDEEEERSKNAKKTQKTPGDDDEVMED